MAESPSNLASTNVTYDHNILHSNIDPDFNLLDAFTSSSPYYSIINFLNMINNNDLNSNNFLSILHINSRSLLNKLSDLLLLNNAIGNYFNVIVISETWLNDESVNLIDLPGYNFLFKNRSNKKGGGVGIFLKLGLDYTLFDNALSTDDVSECLCIEIKFHNSSAIIFAIYRPPNSDPYHLIHQLDLAFSNLKSSSKVYLVGDFNLDLTKAGSDKSVAAFYDLLASFNFAPLISQPTRVTHSSSSVIDNIFTNNLSYHISGILLHDFSDHYPIFSLCSNYCYPVPTAPIKLCRNFCSDSIRKINLLLSAQDWSSVTSFININTCCSNFYAILFNILDSVSPLLPFKQTYKKNWVNKHIIHLSKIKHKLYIKSIKLPSQRNISAYKKFRNFFTRIKRKTERDFYILRFNNSHDSKSQWNLIKEALNTKCSSPQISKLTINNNTVQNKLEICEHFNEHFINISNKLLSNLPPVNTNPLSYMGPPISHSIGFHPITRSELLTLSGKLKNKKSYSDDGLNMFLVKNIISNIIVPLLHIFNLSLSSGIFPDCFKTSKVIPIFKKGDNANINNYRPISLLSPLSKILEKAVYMRLFSFFETHKIICNNQYGFRPSHSTELALLDYLHHILSKLNDKKLSVGLFLDLSKAFDVIDHNILLDKLHCYGIRGETLKWIQSYLSQRNQYVTIDNYQSSKALTSIGVPQGSILGPLLFLIYINDIHNISPETKCILFADDTNLLFTPDNISCSDYINSVLSELSNWFSSNKLTVNYSKCSYIIFGPKILTNQVNNLNLMLNNVKINRVLSTKFLGVTISDNLSWDIHLQSISLKINKLIGIFYNIKNKLSRSALKILYNAFIYPYLTYCILLWGHCPNSHLNCLHVSQKRAIRLIFNLKPYSHTRSFFVEHNILSLSCLYIYFTAIFVYKFLNNLLPPSFSNFYIYSNSVQILNTRHSSVIYPFKTRLKLIATSLKILGPKIWQLYVPTSIRNITDLYNFKIKLRSRLSLLDPDTTI